MSDLPGLLACQNPDGGWAYRSGSSWIEPTVYALLALVSTGEVSSPVAGRALRFMHRCQRPDGGWAPRLLVDESTWVTALVLLLPPGMLSSLNTEGALRWLVTKTGRESSWIQRLKAAMISGRVETAVPDGWPWFPDTAAWVAPTAITILALRKAARRNPRPEIDARIRQGQEFLMSRVCVDGGWNHGSTKALGYDGPSYPETTGVALMALQGLPANRLARGIRRAEQHLRLQRSLEATSWLQLGLLAQGHQPAEVQVLPRRPLSTQEIALAAIAASAMRGRNILED